MARRPNIVLILVDDLGFGDFGCLNDHRSHTPCLDALLGESHAFSQHYAASPVCNPSRAALLTGRYPHRTGSIDTLEWRGLERLNLDEITLANVLRGNGYRTGLIGKWHLGAFDQRYRPEARGFQKALCFHGGMHDYYDWRLKDGDHTRKGDGRYLTDLWTDEAINFIETPGAEPFFLHLTYNAPHAPLQAPSEDYSLFADRLELTPAVRTLYAMVHRLDQQIGRFLEALDRNQLRENTIVLFMSDNGPQFGGEGDACLDRFNGGLHGAKYDVYDGGLRVPAVLRWPGGLPGQGWRHNAFIHMTDWFPTLLSLVGIPVPKLSLDGTDQAQSLRGEEPFPTPQRCWHWTRYEPRTQFNAAIREGSWKLVRPGVPEVFAVPDLQWLEVAMYDPEYFEAQGILTDAAPEVPLPPPPPVELYDLASDPGETINLADGQTALVDRLSGDLERWFEDVLQHERD